MTLDSLFYKDAILPRLRRIGIGPLKKPKKLPVRAKRLAVKVGRKTAARRAV